MFEWEVILEGDEECQSVMCFDFALGLLTPPKPKGVMFGEVLDRWSPDARWDNGMCF
jgi:hypothetical protein